MGLTRSNLLRTPDDLATLILGSFATPTPFKGLTEAEIIMSSNCFNNAVRHATYGLYHTCDPDSDVEFFLEMARFVDLGLKHHLRDEDSYLFEAVNKILEEAGLAIAAGRDRALVEQKFYTLVRGNVDVNKLALFLREHWE